MRLLLRDWDGSCLQQNKDYSALMYKMSRLKYMQYQEFYVKYGDYHYEYLIDISADDLAYFLCFLGKEYNEPLTITYNAYIPCSKEVEYRVNLFACFPELTIWLGERPESYDDDWDEWFS